MLWWQPTVLSSATSPSCAAACPPCCPHSGVPSPTSSAALAALTITASQLPFRRMRSRRVSRVKYRTCLVLTIPTWLSWWIGRGTSEEIHGRRWAKTLSITNKMLPEQEDRINTPKDSSGQPSIWHDIYKKMHCPGPPFTLYVL